MLCILCLCYNADTLISYNIVAEVEQVEFNEDMDPDQLSAFLRDNQVPKKDCEKIKGKAIDLNFVRIYRY